MNRKPTETESFRNLMFRHNGTAIPGIHPKRMAILGAIQEIRPTTGRDDSAVYAHLRSIGSI